MNGTENNSNIDVDSTVADLPTHTNMVEAETTTEQVKSQFDHRPDLPGVIIMDRGQLLAVVSRDTLFRRLSGPYCRELFLRKPIRDFIAIWQTGVLRVKADCTIHRAAELALGREHEEAYEPILVDFGGRGFGLLDAYALLVAQSQLLSLSRVVAEQRDAAEAANRSKSEFLANISHELRTPLHGILSYARFGVNEADEAEREELRGFFQNVSQSADTLLRLVNDLLDLSKLEAGKMTFELQPNSIDLLVQAVVDEFNSMCAEKSVHVLYESLDPDADTTAMVDPDRFKQVIRNLLSNAVKFSPPEGRIFVRARPVGNSVLMSVRDEGPGIPPNELETVFDKFVQSSKTKSGSGGTGLGLAICREIVGGHRGRIWAENNGGGGCIFYCELPKQPARVKTPDDDDEAEAAREFLHQYA
jgi:signal transduction histidine kinase